MTKDNKRSQMQKLDEQRVKKLKNYAAKMKEIEDENESNRKKMENNQIIENLKGFWGKIKNLGGETVEEEKKKKDKTRKGKKRDSLEKRDEFVISDAKSDFGGANQIKSVRVVKNINIRQDSGNSVQTPKRSLYKKRDSCIGMNTPKANSNRSISTNRRSTNRKTTTNESSFTKAFLRTKTILVHNE